jgi:acylphosphatase
MALVIRRRVVAHGRVQGVFFRDTCRHLATKAGVGGWARNLPDGTFEAVFEGEPEAVDFMVAWSRHGPSKARVDTLDVYDEQPDGMTTFTVC